MRINPGKLGGYLLIPTIIGWIAIALYYLGVWGFFATAFYDYSSRAVVFVMFGIPMLSLVLGAVTLEKDTRNKWGYLSATVGAVLMILFIIVAASLPT